MRAGFLPAPSPFLVSLGDRIDNWLVSWLGGWDKFRVFFIVMVEREYEQPVATCNARVAPSESVGFRNRHRP